jgi:hypothetical protein
MDAQQLVPAVRMSRIRHLSLATKNTAPACETQTGAAIKQTN